MNGLDPPAAADRVPAVKAGTNAIGLVQPVTEKEEDGVASEVVGALHGTRSDVVVAVPHVCGLASGARGPPSRRTLSSLKGSCGLSRNVAVSCPVAGLAATAPSSFRTTPDPSASRYTR